MSTITICDYCPCRYDRETSNGDYETCILNYNIFWNKDGFYYSNNCKLNQIVYDGETFIPEIRER